MSLSPKDLDFVEARNAAAREIALSLGVPPQLLGIPGDSTYSNYQEANRAFFRQTVVPLVNRITAALSHWFAEPLSPTLSIKADLDDADALTPEREALWSRLSNTTFLTVNEKRQAAGYGPFADGHYIRASTPDRKYSPDQPRDGSGRWSGGSGSDEPDTGASPDDTTLDNTDGNRDPSIIDAARRGGFTKEVMKWTVRQFVSQRCKGSINRELPGQYENITLEDLLALAKGGDATARKCYKILNEPRFRK